MLRIYKTNRGRYSIAAGLASLMFVLGATFYFNGLAPEVNAIGTNIITVDTTLDEDSHPAAGVGCSLYEAIIAAETNAAYSGCAAGSATDNDHISLAAGTYKRDAAAGPMADDPDDPYKLNILALNNVSLIGAGVSQTMIDGYGFNMTGNAQASVEKLSLRTPASYDHPTFLFISGSNKVAADLTLSNDGPLVPVVVSLAKDNETVENITLTRIKVLAERDVHNPSTRLSCGERGEGNNWLGTCSDITLDDVDFTANNSTGVDMPQADIKIINSRFTVLSDGASEVSLGQGSSIDGLVQTHAGNGGSLAINGFATSVRNVTQKTTGDSMNGSVGLDIASPLVENYIADTQLDAVLRMGNPYEGAVIKNVNMKGLHNIYFTTKPKEMRNITAQSGTEVHFDNSYNGASYIDVLLSTTESTGDSEPFIVGHLDGDNMKLNNFQTLNNNTHPRTWGIMNVTGDNTTVNNLNMKKATMRFAGSGAFALTNFSIEGASSQSVNPLNISGAFSSASIKNGRISDTRDGVFVQGLKPDDSLLDASVTIQNVQFDNMIQGDESAPAIRIVNLQRSTIKDVTISRSVQQLESAIHIDRGYGHEIINTTISNSNSGIELTTYGNDTRPMKVDINNVTVVNDENGPYYEKHEYATALRADVKPSDYETEEYSGDEQRIDAVVSNSIFGGTSPYTRCSLSENVALVVSHSITTDPSCAYGFTAVDNLNPIIEPALADNGSENARIGFNGVFGNLRTRALRANSQAVGAGDTATCADVDARGKNRPAIIGCDVGAYQTKAAVVIDPGDDTSPGGTDSDGDTHSSVGINNPADVKNPANPTARPKTTIIAKNNDPSKTSTDPTRGQEVANDSISRVDGGDIQRDAPKSDAAKSSRINPDYVIGFSLLLLVLIIALIIRAVVKKIRKSRNRA